MTREEIDPRAMDVMLAQQLEQGTQGPPNDQKGSGSVSQDDIIAVLRQNHLERQRKKEESILQEKKRAAALIRELLRMEEKRISCIMAAKDKMVNEDLYARYEITRSDRTKIIVSMSEKTADEYRLVHPGCCMYRI